MDGSACASAAGLRRDETGFRSLGILAVGLTLVDAWGDMKGSLPVLAGSNELIESIFVNGRMVGLFGIALCLFLVSIKPVAFARYSARFRWAAAIVASTMSAVFVFLPVFHGPCVGAAGIGAVILSGVCYGLFEVLLLGELCRNRSSLKKLAVVLAFALAAKSAILPLVGSAPAFVQTACFVAAPLFIGLSCSFSSVGSLRSGGFSSGSFREMASSNIIVILVLFSILNAAARSVSDFGFWGEGGLIASDGIGPMLVGVPIFLLVAYVGFAACEEQGFVSCAIKLLFVLLCVFFILGSGILERPAVPFYVADAIELFADVYSTFLLRVAIVATAKTTSMHPYAVVGVGDGSMCVLSLIFGGVFSFFPTAGLSVLLLAMFITATAALLMLEKSIDRMDLTQEESSVEASCLLVAQKCGLTPRETEVLVLLAQGRSQRFIAEEMTLAPSTVKTHVKHVYQKMGVCNKQELISFVQDT